MNNGIGIRTPMGVDAAFHGMEIQVLDHDDPIYKNIEIYQQHGSVYGVIPAKRVKFGELGTWNVEEIRAVGDRITVTVNGEVILDGNIRKACKGTQRRPPTVRRRIPTRWTDATTRDSSTRRDTSACWDTVRASVSATSASRSSDLPTRRQKPALGAGFLHSKHGVSE